MKNITIKTKFDDCKTLREVLDKIDDKFFNKSSFILLSSWVLYPLLMMFLTYKFNNEMARNIMFYLLTFIGGSGILIGTIYSLKKFYKKEKIDLKKYLPIIIGIILLLWCLFTSFFAPNYSLTFTGELYRKEGLETYFFYSGVLILGILIRNKKLINILMDELLIVEVIMSIIALMNNTFTFSVMHNLQPYTGVFSQFNHYAYYLMFGILASIFKFVNNKNLIKKILYLIIYSLLLYTLIINDTFGCFLAILITLILIFIYYIKKLIKILPVIVIFIVLCFTTTKYNQNIVRKNFDVFFKDSKVINDTIKINKKDKLNEKDKLKKEQLEIQINNVGTSRGVLWRYGIKYIFEKPIIGHGIETIMTKYELDNIYQSRPHNILIQMGVATGIPGIILYSLFILVILIRVLKRIKELDELNIFCYFICVCYLMSSMFGNSMFYTSPYLFIFLGITIKNAFYRKELK